MGRNYSNWGRGSSKPAKSKYSEAEKFAYKLGQVQTGCNNKNSKVYESYTNGEKSTTKPDKKPMF